MADSGLAKCSIVDDGVGMSGDDLERYIGELASSGKHLGRTANLGVGVKIACAPRQDTFQAPKALVENRSRWLLRYLNRRFFALPDVDLRVRSSPASASRRSNAAVWSACFHAARRRRLTAGRSRSGR